MGERAVQPSPAWLRTRDRHGFMRLRGALLPVLAALGACASTSPNALPKYQPPPRGTPSASIVNAGSSGRVWAVDGAETPSFARTTQLAPGVHRVGLMCLAMSYTVTGGAPMPVVLPKSAIQSAQVTGSFVAGATYYVGCESDNGQPHVWIADTPAGRELPPGFESICTRECPQ